MKKTITLTLMSTVLWLSFANITYAQNGSNDATFNVTDNGFGYGDATNGGVNAIAIQSNGKVIIAGSFTTYHGTSRNNIARLNADGSLDATFTAGTGANGTIEAIVIQSNGKVIIAGSFSTYNGTPRNNIARLNADGSLDATFTVGTGANGNIRAIALQSDGKIIIGGGFTTYNGTARGRIARINTNGTIDATFAAGAGANAGVRALVIQGDGKVIIGGSFSTYNGTPGNDLARLSATDGSLDDTFTTGNGVDGGLILALALQSNGKLIVGGYFEAYNGTARNAIVRVNTNGSIDNTFDAGSGENDDVAAVAVQSDDKILISGSFYNDDGKEQNGGIMRLNDTGSLDDSFAVGAGLGLGGTAWAIKLQDDGKIIVGGSFASYAGVHRHGVARVNTNGSLDFTFIKGTGANSDVYATLVQSDGKILIGGDFTSYNGTAKNHITRLNADGTPDASFTGVGTDSTVHAMAIQGNGKIIIGGNFETCNGRPRNRLARLNTNGSLDESFDPGANAGLLYNHVYAIAVQPDGKIIVGGNILKSEGQGWKYTMVRLNTDGSLDAAFSFDEDDYFFGDVRTLAIQSDGKIIMGGNFILRSGNDSRFDCIARLDTNGKIDATFRHEIYHTEVTSVAIQNDGKIVIGGYFSAGAYKNIARLNTNGSLDGTFMADKNTNGSVHSILIHEGGKIIIGGGFTAYGGTTRNRIVRLTATGSLDNTFNVGVGANNTILSMALQVDGKIVVAGGFTAYNGVGRNRIARILNCTNPAIPTASASAVTNCGKQNTTLSIATGELNSAAAWKWYSGTCVGTPVGTGASISVSPAVATTYYVRGEGGCITPGACGAITIDVKPLPDATVGLSGKTITAKLSGAAYQWLDCRNNNTPVDGATSQSYTAASTGRYAVSVTANGCSATSACVDIVITAIGETVAQASTVAVYPNPSDGAFTVQCAQRGVYAVRNILGQTVHTFELNDANHYTVNITDLQPDIYFITRTDHNIPPVKVIVVR